jgi:hypothetical protein
MFGGLDFGFPVLFITWSTLAVGAIPILWAWLRIADQWHNTGPRVIPKALCALTASICFGPAANYVCGALSDSTQGTFDIHPIWFSFLVAGFILNVTALVMALREQSAARAAVLAGSIAVAVVNAAGFIWLFVATNGSPLSH